MKLLGSFNRLMATARRYFWASLLVFLLGLALLTSSIIQSRQSDVRQAVAQNISAFALRGVVELQNLQEALHDPDPDARLHIERALEIVTSRVDGFKTGMFGRYIMANPENAAGVVRMSKSLSEIETILDLRDEAYVEHIQDKLNTLTLEMNRMASQVHAHFAEHVDGVYFSLISLERIFNGLVFVIVSIGMVLFFKLLRQRNSIRNSKVELLILANNLEAAKIEVEQAHEEVQRSNENLKRRNKMLQIHDIEMRTQNDRFDAALNNIAQGLLMVDDGHRLIICNQKFRDIFGFTIEQTRPGNILGVKTSKFVEIFANENTATPDAECGADFARLIIYQNERITSGDNQPFSFETESGRMIAVSQQPMPEGGWVATYEDVTERHKFEERITYLAHHDPLTDLPNRVRLREKMSHELDKYRENKNDLTLFYMDLDHFKSVNDSYGHAVGDLLLAKVSARLKQIFVGENLVFRIGGDEFAGLYFGKTTKAHLSHLCHSIIAAIREPYTIEGHQLHIGICLGLARVNSPHVGLDELVSNADMALFQAKKSGRNTFRFFEPTMKSQLESRRNLEFDLERGLRDGQFSLEYQPIVDAQTLEIVCFEALLRWTHPQRGAVSPGIFIPIAEESGLIVPLGEWALRQACRDAAAWPKQTRVAVNLSSVQFKAGQIARTVFSALAAARLAPHLLELEITESILLQDSDATLSTLHQLRSFGIRISMDDFGTGYSSLGYLRSFPFDKIKIDRSFVTDIEKSEESRAIVRTIAELGRSLKMITTAEGVETREQFEAIKAVGCEQIQGYLFGAPVPVDKIPALFGKVKKAARAA